MKFTVERSRWIRGADGRTEMKYQDGEPGKLYTVNDASLLRTRDNKMCCLGFVCAQLGVNALDLADVDTPCDLRADILDDERIAPLVDAAGRHTELASEALDLNDDVAISGADREQALAKLFADHGHELEFVP